MLNELTSKLLFVPFNRDYTVPLKIRELLTEDEFFEHCFVNTDFEEEIKRVNKADRISIDDSGDKLFVWEKAVSEEIQRLKDHQDAEKNFWRWIKDDGNGIYCIRGDAGTGKTTYLHHLKYHNKDIPISWEILDIQKAHTPVRFLSRTLIINNFATLDGKMISVFLIKILNAIFDKSETEINSLSHRNSGSIFYNLLQIFKGKPRKVESDPESRRIANNLARLYQNYRNNVQRSFPLQQTRWFFDDSPLFRKSAFEITKTDLEKFELYLYERVDKLLKEKITEEILDSLQDVYMTILRSKDSCRKHIIAIDNVERIIGEHEICNTQAQKLIDHMRHTLDSYAENDPDFFKKFQMIVLMRNTSSRMSDIPLHRIDFGGHELNLSGWFPIDRIVFNKLQWYEKKNIPVEGGYLIDEIIGKNGFDGCGPRSLQVKLSMLFNHNNRVILTLLTKAIELAHEVDPYPLEVFNMFKENKTMPQQLTRFAARTIIIRMVLNVLKDDDFFRKIATQKALKTTGNPKSSDSIHNLNSEEKTYYERLGYARKIFTALYDYSLHHQEDIAGEFMPFDELIQAMFGAGDHYVRAYFDKNNYEQREMLTQVLFFMNYYDGRKHNWLHFIDIQYNIPNSMGLDVSNEAELQKLIDEKHSEIGIRIMDAGIAFLYYIIQSFEYFSCRVEDEKFPPLLCLIPTREELSKCNNIENLPCLSVIRRVSKDAFTCFNIMEDRAQKGAKDIPYRRTLDDMPLDHKTRVIRAHEGYINNFCDCVKSYYSEDPDLPSDVTDKLDLLYDKLENCRKEYLAKL